MFICCQSFSNGRAKVLLQHSLTAVVLVVFELHVVQTELFVLLETPFVMSYLHLRISIRRVDVLQVTITGRIVEYNVAAECFTLNNVRQSRIELFHSFYENNRYCR